MAVIIEGLTLGLSTGGYCLSACLPILLPYMLSEGKKGLAANAKLIIEFLSGRLIAYIIFAVIISLLGERFKGVLPAKLLAAGMIITALLMITYAITKNFSKLKFCERLAQGQHLSRMPFLLGFLIGINVCPPFFIGTIRLLELGSVFLGAVFFFFFFLGTSIYILPLLSLAWAVKIKRLQNIGNMIALIVGAWFLMIGIITLLR